MTKSEKRKARKEAQAAGKPLTGELVLDRNQGAGGSGTDDRE